MNKRSFFILMHFFVAILWGSVFISYTARVIAQNSNGMNGNNVSGPVDGDGDGVLSTSDCNDANPLVWQYLSGYVDGDKDGFGFGPSTQVCSGSALPLEYAANNTDCAEGDVLRWQNLSGYTDGDRDGFGAGAAQTVCSGASLPAGYSTNNTDCADGDVSIWRFIGGYFDSDGDGAGSGALLQVCSGASLAAEYSANNTDCAPGDGTKWRLIFGYFDGDKDSFGDPAGGIFGVCSANTLELGYASNNSDCDDGSGAVTTSATDICYPDPPLGQPSTAGIGECSWGQITCTSGVWDASCTGYTLPQASDATCNNKDEDCDSTKDEDYAPIAITCGQGDCLRNGQRVCVNGAETEQCTAGAKGVEVCDSDPFNDEDCNGSANEICNCVDGDTVDCYSGRAGSELNSPCKKGTMTCFGGNWGACAGEVVPKPDDRLCNGTDDDCDGSVDEEYIVTDTACGTAGSICARTGKKQCISGAEKDSCVAGTAGTEVCDAGFVDEDCDGVGNQPSVCKCVSDDARSCYSGPAGTLGKGICMPGEEKCVSGNWSGSCAGETLPKAEVCDAARLDENCRDGANENCECIPGEKRDCYNGPPETLNSGGICRAGTQACDVNGKWEACAGEVLPQAQENCNNSLDDDCNGIPNDTCVPSQPPFVRVNRPKNTKSSNIKSGRAVFLFYGQETDIEAIAKDPDGGSLTYRWSQTEGAVSITLANTTSAKVHIRAPQATTVAKLEVVATDNEGESGKDTVDVVVNPDCRNSVK